MSPRISIIVPVLNEEQDVVAQLEKLQALRGLLAEVIVVDGGSEDRTTALARPLADKLVIADRGRARQMNAGAQHAQGEALFFLHLDTSLPESFPDILEQCITGDWGFFRVRLSGRQWQFRIIETAMSWRSSLTGIATGDQLIFCSKAYFSAVNGFPEIALMEDVAFSKLLKKHGKPEVIKSPVTTSSRRWEQQGIVRTVLLMWWLRLAYFFGANPDCLVKRYYVSGSGTVSGGGTEGTDKRAKYD